jgi:hypothetical protein
MTRPHRVVVCRGCGLIYTNPRSNRTYMDEFYAGTFRSDAGAPQRRGEDLTHSFEKRVAGMKPLVESLLDDLGDPKGKRWLELRCRTAVVAEISHVMIRACSTLDSRHSIGSTFCVHRCD